MRVSEIIGAGILFAPFFRLLPKEPEEGERIKTPEEIRLEGIIKGIYQSYLRETTVGGQKLLLRIPFGERNERFWGQRFFKGGKGSPEECWQKIDRIMQGPLFAEYSEALSQPGRKLILFNLPERTFRVVRDEEEMEKIKETFWDHRAYPYEMKEDGKITAIDLYNLFYNQGVGIDCSGFSFRIQIGIAWAYGIDLCREIGEKLGIEPAEVPSQIGTQYYVEPGCTELVDDIFHNFRPGDLVVFPSWRRPNCHSADVVSINYRCGVITYAQNTDWVADREKRGPQTSEVCFDPASAGENLHGSSARWMHRFGPVFSSETCSWEGLTDGYRYNLDQYGGRYPGRVVRLPQVAKAIKEKEPSFYENAF